MPTLNDEKATLLDLCAHPQIDELPMVELLVKTIGANQTMSNSHEPLLATIIRNFAKYSISDTTMLPLYIEIFLRHSFDMHRYGTVCLQALSESIQDEQLLEAAQLFLEQPFPMPLATYQALIDSVNFKIAYHDFQSKNHYLANLYFAYQKMLSNHFSPKAIRYPDITPYTCAYEQKINSIMINPAEYPRKHLYLFLTNGILIIQNHPNLYMCSAIEILPTSKSAFSLTPLAPLSSLVRDKTIQSIAFSTATFYPLITIKLNYYFLQISHNTESDTLEISFNNQLYL